MVEQYSIGIMDPLIGLFAINNIESSNIKLQRLAILVENHIEVINQLGYNA